MREIEFNPQNPGKKKKEGILERNPRLLLMREEDDEALVIVFVN